MTTFLILFAAAMILAGIPLGILGLINRHRGKRSGCSGNHECVVYNGEKVRCPACELREFKAAIEVSATLEKPPA